MHILRTTIQQIQKKGLLLMLSFGLYGTQSFAQVPANDNPCGAIALTPSTGSCNYQTFTNLNATQSTGMNNAQCGTPVSGDVWFSITVPAGVTTLSITTEGGTLQDGVMQLYRSNSTPASCSSLTRIGGTCTDDVVGTMPAVVATGLTPGSTIWVRFWNYDDGIIVTPQGTFGICVMAAPPSNDNPCNAISLTVGQNCNSQIFSNAGATASSGVPAPNCSNYTGGDVWFTATVPAAGGLLVFDTQEGTMTDGGMALYTGTCNSLTLVDCDDDSGTGLMPQIATSSLTPGSTVWIRVWEYGNNNNGTFGICVSNPPPAPPCAGNAPAGDSCETATPVCNFNGYCGSTSAAYGNESTWWPDLEPAFSDCIGGGSIENNSFVTFVADSTSAQFNVWVSNSALGFGIQMFFFDVPTCQSATINCHGAYNDLLESPIPHLITANNLIPGQTYYLMFDGVAGDVCDYVLAPVNGVSVLSVTPNAAAICPGGTVQLSVSGGVGQYTWNGPGLSGASGATVTVTPPSTATYTVTSTNTAGSCPVNQSVVVTVNTPPSLTASGTNPSCTTICDGSATVTATGTAPFTYNWSNGGTTATINNLCVGTYTVTVTDANGCSSSNSGTTPVASGCFQIQNVLIDACSTPEYDNEMVFFKVGQAPLNTASLTVTWPTAADSWLGLTTNPSYISTMNATITGGGKILPLPVNGILPANAQAVLITGPASNSAYDFTNLSDTLYALFQNAGNTQGHFGNYGASSVKKLIMDFGTGCTDTVAYDRSLLIDQTGGSTAQDGASIDYTENGTATYINNGCVLPTLAPPSQPVVLTAPSPITPTFTQVADICNGGSFTLPTSSNETPAITGTWSPNNNNTQTTQYTFTPTTGLCASTTTMTVAVITPAGPTVTSPVDYCIGATVVQPLSASGTGLLWYTGATGGTGSSSAPTIPTPVTTASTYYVTQTINGCESPRVPISVTVSAPNFSIDAGAPLYIALGSGAQANPVLTGITSGQLSNILWTPPTGLDNPSSLNPIITPSADGTYTYDVTITNAIGCTATDQLVVNVSSECIHVKNAFTPNGDGINELWEVYDQYSCLKNVKVHVYNRYGSKVYESDDYRNNWDGKFKGKPLPDGTYYAVIEFSLMTGKVYTVRTDVSILR